VENQEITIIANHNAIIIDKQTKLKKAFVIVIEYSNKEKRPYAWNFDEKTEEIIYKDISIANSLYKAKWNGTTFIEAATKEEIKQIEDERKKEFGIPNTSNEHHITENEMLKAQNKALSDRLDFTEELIAELAKKVY
jgi:hypothetical protein